jgi:hypothetical protein
VGAAAARGLRFGLRDLLLLFFLIGLALAAGLRASRSLESKASELYVYPPVAIAAIALAANRLALGARRGWAVGTVLVLAATCSCLLWPTCRWLYDMEAFGLGYYYWLGPTDELYRAGFLATAD